MAEYTLVNVQDLFGKARLDAEFYQRRYIENERQIRRLPNVETLGEIVTSFRKGIFDINASEYQESGVPFIRIGNLKDWIIDESGLAYISEERHRNDAKTALVRGDIILSKTARPAASLVQLDQCNTSQDTIAVKTGRPFEYNVFLVAFLNTTAGWLQLERLFQGNVQAHLSLDEARTILIPQVPEALILEVAALFAANQESKDASRQCYADAEARLAEALGLGTLVLPTPKTYTAMFSEVVAAERMDSDFFRPKYRILLDHLGQGGETVGTVAPVSREKYKPGAASSFEYFEIGGLEDAGRAETETVPLDERPSRAQWLVRSGDVLTSTVRPIRRLTAFVRPEQAGSVASSGFVVLRPERVLPEVLTVYLRLPIVAELLDLFTTATMYPAISERDVAAFPFPTLASGVQQEVADLVQESLQSHEDAARLLAEATARVEALVLGA